jgi:predicted  nucleic acid-binding Zn-ribbon protein
MKLYLSIILGIACVGLAIALYMKNQGDAAQHESDTAAITDFSNRLDTAQLDLATRNGSMMLFSNSLDESRSEVLTFSNRLAEAEARIAPDLEQITNLNQHVATLESDNQTLVRCTADLTNQLAVLSGKIASAQTSLIQTNQDLVQAYKDYGLLENRLRRDVAERVVMERKFDNILELQEQIQNLKENPFEEISIDRIYTGLDVEVKSNGSFHVLLPD